MMFTYGARSPRVAVAVVGMKLAGVNPVPVAPLGMMAYWLPTPGSAPEDTETTPAEVEKPLAPKEARVLVPPKVVQLSVAVNRRSPAAKAWRVCPEAAAAPHN